MRLAATGPMTVAFYAVDIISKQQLAAKHCTACRQCRAHVHTTVVPNAMYLRADSRCTACFSLSLTGDTGKSPLAPDCSGPPTEEEAKSRDALYAGIAVWGLWGATCCWKGPLPSQDALWNGAAVWGLASGGALLAELKKSSLAAAVSAVAVWGRCKQSITSKCAVL